MENCEGDTGRRRASVIARVTCGSVAAIQSPSKFCVPRVKLDSNDITLFERAGAGKEMGNASHCAPRKASWL